VVITRGADSIVAAVVTCCQMSQFLGRLSIVLVEMQPTWSESLAVMMPPTLNTLGYQVIKG
jgi:hypothetical protein